MTFREFFNHNHLLLEANPEKRNAFLLSKYTDQIRKYWKDIGLSKHLSPEDTEVAIVELVRGIVFNTDPTEGEYSEWILKNYLKMDSAHANRWHEDSYKIYDDLTEYHKYKRLLKQDEQLKVFTDINRIKSFSELYYLVNDEDYSVFGKKIAEAKEKEEQKEMEGQADKIYVSENYLIVVPKSQEASCSYGRNTRWCTASTGSYNYFNQYNKQGPLYIIIDKKQNEKFQFHFQSKQFMNSDDSQIDVKEFLKEHEELKDTIFDLALKNEAVSFCLANFKPEKVIEEVDKMPEEKQVEFIKSDALICFHIGSKKPEFVNKNQTLFEFRDDKVMINTGVKEWADLTDFIVRRRYGNSDPRETAKQILEGEADWIYNNDFGNSYDSDYWNWLAPEQLKRVFAYIKIEHNEDVNSLDEAKSVIEDEAIDDEYIKDLLTRCYDDAYNMSMQNEYYQAAIDAIESVICASGEKQKHFRNAQDEIVLIHDKKGVGHLLSYMQQYLDEGTEDARIGSYPSEFMDIWRGYLEDDNTLGDANFDNIWGDPDKETDGEVFRERFDSDFEMPKRQKVQPELELSNFEQQVANYMKLFQEEAQFNTFYHVSPSTNTQSILSKGLIPMIGGRSEQLETEKAIYMFRSIDDVDDAMMNWLGEEFEDESIDLFKIMLPKSFPIIDDPDMWEVVSEHPIKSEYVYLLQRQYGE